MSRKRSAGLLPGLILEGTVIGLVVTLLPKVQLGKPVWPPQEAADQRPSLAPRRLPPIETNWRTAISRPPVQAPRPADAAYVERRLEAAGQQLLGELSHHAQQLLRQPSPDEWQPQVVQPPSAGRGNAFRY